MQLVLPVANLFQEEYDEPIDMVRRVLDLAELQQVREQLVEKLEAHQNKIKIIFEKKAKVDNF